MTYLPYIVGTIAFLIALPSLFVVGLLVWHLLLDSLPTEDAVDEQPEDVTLVDENLPRALHRVKELKYRWQACGHATYQFDPERGECLQCVLEGRVASRDMGRR
jgi:hypothetical protein